MEKLRKKPVIAFVALFAALYVIIYVIPRVTGALRFSYIAEYGGLEISDNEDSYFIRNEKVYFSSISGTENRYIDEGKLIRRGTRVLNVEKGEERSPDREYAEIRDNIGKAGISTSTFASDSEGIVTYSADGYEAVFSPEKIEKKKLVDFKKLDNDLSVQLKRDTVSTGDPVFKIVDRSGWYIVTYIPRNHKDRYSLSKKYPIVIDEKYDIKATLKSISDEGNKLKLVFESDYYFKTFTTLRTAKVKIITSEANGLIIYNTSITKKNGRKGVFVKQGNGKYRFTPIQIITGDDEKSIITKSIFYDEKGNVHNTVKNYDEILKKA